jgi:hypothetical protein
MRRTASKAPAPAARLGEHVPFNACNVARTPASAGVYFLYDRHRLIYIGVAANGVTIRERLFHHLRGQGGRCMQFDYEMAADPLSLQRLYLRIYRECTAGLLPECNEEYFAPALRNI